MMHDCAKTFLLSCVPYPEPEVAALLAVWADLGTCVCSGSCGWLSGKYKSGGGGSISKDARLQRNNS